MSLDNIWQVSLKPYAIPLTKPEIDALDMVLSSASKDCFGGKENNEIIHFLSRKFSRYRTELEKENGCGQ